MGTAFPRVPAQLHPWSYDAITGATYSTALKTTARAYVQMVGYWNPIASQQGNAGDGWLRARIFWQRPSTCCSDC